MKEVHLQVPSREQVINVQVATLLGIAATLTPFVMAPITDTSIGRPEMDGGVASSVATTLMAVCDRLTGLVQEKSCWGLEGIRKLETALQGVYDEHRKALEATTYTQRVHSSPVAIFRPTLGRTANGKCFALHGDLNSDAYVLGIGDTLEEAAQDFNLQFKKRAEAHNTIIDDTPNLTEPPKDERKE